MNIGLYFGSFNPIHIGHLLVATHIREKAQLDEIWFIVSPQNPFKINSELADEKHRLQMVNIAIENINYFKAIDIEFNLPKPSYTHITLKELSKKFPENNFSIIIGEDNIAKYKDWKEANWIQENFEILVYNRKTENNTTHHSSFIIQHLPLIDISSTEIRERIKNNLPINYFVTENVKKYLLINKIY